MHQLVQDLEASGEFDLILFDTPPVLGLADAALVAEHCDGLMLLVSLDRVDRGLPREAVNRIRSSGAPLLGIVTNAIKPERQGASAYGYGQYGYGNYGYGYGYGYGGYCYAAYDPAAAYAHYAEAEPEGGDTAGVSRQQRRVTAAPKAPSSLRERVAQRRRQLMRWLDN